jgi:hypothetical protein
MESTLNKTIFCKKLTRNLYNYRIALGYSSNKVREETDIDVNKIEHCESNLTVFTLYTLLRFYGKSMSEFFTDLEEETIANIEDHEKHFLENHKQK